MKKQSFTTFKVYQENMRTGATSPYLVTEVSNSVKTGDMAKVAVQQVSNQLHLVNSFPKDYKTRVEYSKVA